MSSRERAPSRVLQVLAGLLISAGFVVLAVLSLSSRGVSWDSVRSALTGGKYGYVAIYFGLLLVLAVVRVLRWGMLIGGLGEIGWRKITGVALVGQGAIGLLPMRLGEAVRPLLIVERDEVNFAQATATIVVERVVDGIILGLIFAGTLWALADQDLPPEFRVGAYLTTTIFGSMALFLALGSLFHRRILALLRRTLGRLAPRLTERLAGLVESFLLALRTIASQRRQTGGFLLLTLFMWVITGLSLLPIFAAFGLNDLGAVASFTVICVMVLGYMIPAGPAATGTLNVAIIVGLNAVGVAGDVTGALAILLYVLLLVTNLLVGLLGLWIGRGLLGSGWSLRDRLRAR